MTYRISGLEPRALTQLYGLSERQLAERGAIRMRVTERPGFPCRIRLDDAERGETMLLVNHVSLDAANPYRASHAIFVTEGAEQRAEYVDSIPPALDRRVLSLRAFDASDMMAHAVLTEPGMADAAIRRLFANAETAYIHAHNAVRGCFAAKVERFG